jgi:hypothetical protein
VSDNISESTRVFLCVCIRNDCSVRAFGPFCTRESAQEECWVMCDHAHLVAETTFGNLATVLLYPGKSATSEDLKLHRAWEWRYGAKLFRDSTKITIGYSDVRTIDEQEAWENFMRSVNG